MTHEHDLQINFENLVANLADGVYFADPQGKIMYANQGLSNLLGYESPAEVMGMFLYDFLDGKNAKRVREFYSHCPEKFGTARLEVQLLRSDGSFVWTEARPTLKNLNTCPKGSFGVVRDISEFKRLEERLHNLAITDELTGLYNRRGFRLMAEQELRHAKRINAETVLLSMDVDDFKSINDIFGHDEGDMVLKMVATTLNESFRETDIISRWGGDEFIVLALDAPSGFVPLLSDRFQHNLTSNAQKVLLPYSVSVTIGVESTDIFEDFTLNRLIMGADHHMYQQKKKKQSQ
ncbi:MAG: diguanylate cyclase [Sphaerochaeta sp.]|nr:diguanylate cyclase [Sphaerochaeta sp.]